VGDALLALAKLSWILATARQGPGKEEGAPEVIAHICLPDVKQTNSDCETIKL